jgi:hypothetical protein
MAILSVQKPALSASGVTLSFASATSAGDSFPNTGIEFVHIVNTGAQRTVTFDSPATCSFGLAAGSQHDQVVTVPPAASAPDNRKIVGPFPAGRFNDGNGRVQITYDDASGITLAVQAAS